MQDILSFIAHHLEASERMKVKVFHELRDMILERQKAEGKSSKAKAKHKEEQETLFRGLKGMVNRENNKIERKSGSLRGKPKALEMDDEKLLDYLQCGTNPGS